MAASSSPMGHNTPFVPSEMPEWGKDYLQAAKENPNAVVGIYKQIVGQSGGLIGKEELRVLQEIKDRIGSSRGLSGEAKKCLEVIEKCQQLASANPSGWKRGHIKPPSMGVLSFSGPKFVPVYTRRQPKPSSSSVKPKIVGSSSLDISDFEGVKAADKAVRQFVQSLDNYKNLKTNVAYERKKAAYDAVKDLIVDPSKDRFHQVNVTKLKIALEPFESAIAFLVGKANELGKKGASCPPEKSAELLQVKHDITGLMLDYCSLKPGAKSNNFVHEHSWKNLEKNLQLLSQKERNGENTTFELNAVRSSAQIIRWSNDSNGQTLAHENMVLDCLIEYCEREFNKELMQPRF